MADPTLQTDIACLECGYNLRGIPDGECPECGEAFTRKHLLALLRRRPFKFGSLAFNAVAWIVLYWLTIGPGLIIGCFLLSAFLDKVFGHTWLTAGFSLLLGAGLTLWFTWAVAADAAQKIAYNRRLRRPNRPPLRVRGLTLAFFLIEVALLAAAPFLVYGLLLLLLD